MDEYCTEYALEVADAAVEAAQAKVDAWNADPNNVVPQQPSDSDSPSDIPVSALEADLHNPR